MLRQVDTSAQVPAVRVIHVTSEIAPDHVVGGLGIAVARLVRQLAAAGASSRVLTGVSDRLVAPRDEAWGELVPLAPNGRSLSSLAWRAIEAGRHGEDALLVAHDDECAELPRTARRRGSSGRVVYWLHSLYDSRGPDEPSRAAGAIDAADIVVVSAGILADAAEVEWPTRMHSLRAALRRASARGAVLTVEATQCLPTVNSPARQVAGGRPRVVCPSRAGVHKGAGILLELADRLAHLDVEFIGIADPATVDLSRRGASRIRWLPWLAPEQLGALLGSADCVVIPSLSEGFGLSAAEAAQLGVPLIYNDIGGLRSLAPTASNLSIGLTSGERAELYALWGDLGGADPAWTCWERARPRLGALLARWVEQVEQVIRVGEPARARPSLAQVERAPTWGEALLERARR